MDADSTDINMQTVRPLRIFLFSVHPYVTTLSCHLVTQPHSTPIVQEQPNPQPNNRHLSHTPNGGERWMRVVEHKFRPTIGVVFASLEAGNKFYEVYARACGFTPRKHSTKTLRGGVAHQKFVVCNRQGFRESKPKQRPRIKDDENMGDGSSTASTVKRRVKITRIGCRVYVRFALLYGLDGPAMIDEFSEVHNHRLTLLSFIFKTARHRYCMWHITQKITDKVGSTLCRDTDFLARFNAVVWDPDMEPSEFEEKWREGHLICLEDNDWLTTMFDDRHHWIPAYHRDLALGCILRTTQRSESTNSFFKRYENHFGTLVEFWMRFQTAMDQQRYTRRCDDYNSDHSFPELKTELPIEKHGAIIYTHAVFKVFQEEVMATDSCGVDDFEKEEHVRIIHVIDVETDRIFKVRLDLRSTDAVCECKLFERIGLLCRHIVWVYKGKGIGRIPRKYNVDRWLNNTHAANKFDSKTLLQRMLNSNGNVIEDSYMATSNNSHLCNVWSEFRQIVGVLKTLPAEHTEELASLLVELRQKLCIEPLTKDQEMEILLGCSSSSEVTIHPPEQARNKGSGKRLKSAKQ
ncbi:uncharacterized protein LOC141619907 [Silene latifolia]|uniref:uncharacterized protein LOC141619907 n=1 Tax=Silene latifolia TaxID=37657 RepID=UPI003D76D315